MVTRKSSLPYPTSPPPEPPKLDPVVPSSNSLMVDSADLPPIPQTYRRDKQMQRGTTFPEDDNPWSDQHSPRLRSDRPMPDILKPRNGRPVEEEKNSTTPDIPQSLRPGNSGQATPRSSIDSDRSRDFWEDDDDEEQLDRKSPEKVMQSEDRKSPVAKVTTTPPSPGIKRKPVGSSALQFTPRSPSVNDGFASNNPFKRTPPADNLQDSNAQISQYLPNWASEGLSSEDKGKTVVRDPWELPIRNNQSSGMRNQSNSMPDLSHYESFPNQNIVNPWGQSQEDIFTAPPPPQPQAPPPPIPQQQYSQLPEQPPLIPVLPEQEKLPNPWESQAPAHTSAPPTPFDQSQKYFSPYNDSMLDRGQQTGVVSLGDELKTLPNATGRVSNSGSQQSLLDDDDIGPPLPSRPTADKFKADDGDLYTSPEGPPPPKPPRPTVRTTIPSDAEVAKITEQRNETYQIKHFNWFDHGSGRLRRSSMLTQNKNGPCPLLALVNALILGAKHESQAALDDALRSREQVSLGLIIETLMDELLSRGYQSENEPLPDVDELNGFLMRLRTGMNANPRFVPPPEAAPNLMDARNSVLHLPQTQRAQLKAGTFEATSDLKLYGAFSVPLLHGWLPEIGSEAAKAFARSAQTYEDAQALQFGEEELEYKLSHGGLSPGEQQMWADINSIKNFLKLHPTQLTSYGLESVQQVLSSGSFAIMFRNDHFSTIYKHPQSGQLFTLITDAGYADRDEIIWESLVDINGTNSEFFSGDFMPVSHTQTDTPQPPGSAYDSPHRRHSSQPHLSVPDAGQTPMTPQERQEQHDADFAMALQLQEEEEQRQRAEQARRRAQQNRTNSGSGPTSSGGGQGNIPIPLRSAAQRQQDAANENRPLIPPRNSRSQMPAVNRPSDALEEDAPPAYEEAAKHKPYNPPVGSPLHPTSEPGAVGGPINQSNGGQLTGTISNLSLGGTGNTASPRDYTSPPPHDSSTPTSRRQPGRRTSAYGEQQQYYGNVLNHNQNSRRSSGGEGQVWHQGQIYNPRGRPLPGGYPGAGYGRQQGQGGRQQAQAQAQQAGERDRDCVVM